MNAVKRKHPLAECESCPLYNKPIARTTAPRNPTTAFVSRSPGHHEAMAGRPFSGPSGEVLNYLLKENGVDRDDILLTNVVLCAPDAGKVPPEAIKACAPRVRAELANIKLLIAAGSEAVNLLIGRGSIDRYRGYRIQQDGRIAVATNNPALVLRDDSTFPNLKRDFRRAFNPLPEPTFPGVEVIEDGEGARAYIARLLDEPAKCISADIESRGGLSHKASIVSMQFSTDGERAVVLGERQGLWNDRAFIESELRSLLESADHSFVYHNGKFDVKILRHSYGIAARVDDDTMLMNYSCDERGGVHALEYCLMEEFGWPDYEPDSVKRFKKTGVVEDYDELYKYAGWDAAGTYQLYERLLPRLDSERTRGSYERLLREGSEAVTRLELAGFRYNIDAAADLMENEVGPELKEKELALRTLIDRPLYKPRSTKQNPILFYDEWKIRHAMQDRPDMKRSCDDAALNEIVSGRFTVPTQNQAKKPLMQSFARELKRFRELDKQASTYIVGMIERAVDDPEGRIYTDLLLHGTVTGRPSSRNPNLLNITRTKEGLPDIRRLFIPSNGRQLVVADYCVVPETKILTTDLTWKNAGDVTEGDSLIGFDESLRGEQDQWARFKQADVESDAVLLRPCYRVITDLGETIASAEHLWAAKLGKTNPRRWIKTEDLRIGMFISYFNDPWKVEDTRDAGWLAGFLDGEAWLSNGNLGFAQNPGYVLDKVLSLFRSYGFDPYFHRVTGESCESYLLRGKHQAAKALGMLRPERFTTRARETWDGRAARGRSARVLAIEPVGEREVCAIGTTARTFIADGFLSHNSQAELRTIGWLSQDSELLRVYNNDEDLHALAASRFYGENFTSEQRSRAKNMNFGVAYGQGAATFQEKHEIPEREAQRFIDWWWLYFKGVKEWKQSIIKEMRTGRVVTPFGRARRFHLLTKENINTAIREAVNFKPQSIAADFTLLAVIKLGGGYSIPAEIDTKRASIILTVYDSIIADVKESYVDEYSAICKQVMESRPSDELGWTVPFKADIGAGLTWADAK